MNIFQRDNPKMQKVVEILIGLVVGIGIPICAVLDFGGAF